MKKCTKCGIEKPFVEFNKSKNQKDGYLCACKICSFSQKSKWKKENPDYTKNYNFIRASTLQGKAVRLLNAARHRANKTNSEITISLEWIVEKLENGFCELTGLPFDFKKHIKHRINPHSPSLDRIDSTNKNYTPENTRVVLTGVNIMLNEWGVDVMRPIIKAMKL